MTNERDKNITATARRTFSLVAEVRDIGAEVRSLAAAVGVDDTGPLRLIPGALHGAIKSMQGEVNTLRPLIGEAVSAHESANGRMALLLDEPCRRSVTVAPGGVMQGYRTADGRNIMLLAVHPDGASPGYSDDMYTDIVLHLDRPALLDSVELTAANVGWGDGRLDVWMPDDCDNWFGEEITPARTDRDAPPACRIGFVLDDITGGGPLRLGAGDHILRIHYYSRNEQSEERTIGIGAATFNLSNY